MAQFELIPWLLGQCASVKEARELIARMNLTNIPFSEKLPLAQLHWLISDRTESITLEAMKDGLHVYDNPVGVLTNNPPFPYQMFQLNNYMQLSPGHPGESVFPTELPFKTYSRGMGAHGTSWRSHLPSPVSSGPPSRN